MTEQSAARLTLYDQVSAGSLLVLVLVPLCEAGLLGAGRGAGSCAAPPYRVEAAALAWAQGCPPHAEVATVSCCGL